MKPLKIVQNLKLRTKLSLLVLVPLGTLMTLAVIDIARFDEVKTADQQFTELVGLSVAAGQLVHEMQKERGASAGYAQSGDPRFKKKVDAQRLETEKKFAAFDAHLDDFDATAYGTPLTDVVNNLRTLRQKLVRTRASVDAQSLAAGDVVRTYSGYNGSLLKTADVLARYSPSGSIANTSAAYSTFMQSKERAGLERAAMSRAFSADQISATQLTAFMRLVTIQDLYLGIFADMANEDQAAFFNERMQNSAVNEVQNMRTTLAERAAQGNFGVDGVTSFETMTRKINLLKEVEDKLAMDLVGMAEAALAASTAGFNRVAIMTAAALFLSLLLVFTISKAVLSAITQALGMANSLADGNLDYKATAAGKDEAGQLLAALSQAQEKLRLTLATSQNVAASVRSGSQGLIESNTALNDRTEQQAESLMRTAASMEEISTIVRKNADSAKEADKLVRDARAHAQGGGEVVKDAIDAMDKINEASKRIEAILAVINEIAFQTNLLALNAAVEAARAGEHGKSFSVVATEVRNLAARSSTAAQEIESLIRDTSEKVAAGVELVNRSGASLEEIVGSVSRISSLVSEIAVSSEEQSSGVDDIRNSVDQLESITQQNLQMVVQATQSTQSMGAQASELSKGLAFFKFSTDMNQVNQIAAPADAASSMRFRPAKAA